MKIIVVGGVAGGATAATRLRRLNEDNEIIIYEKGAYVSFANCGLPYYIGGVIEDRNKLLLQTPESLKARYNLDVRVLTEVVSIDSESKTISVRNVVSGETSTEHYDKLLLSPGAEPIRPPFEGITSPKIYTLRNVADMDRIAEQTVDKNDFVVVGGGFIGLEIAENLIEKGKNVRLIELGTQVMAPMDYEIASFVHNKAKEKGLKLLLNTGVEKFRDEEKFIKVFLNNGEILETEAVILAIGVKPETSLARNAGLEIGETGGILVNEYLQTSDESIYAVGDAIEVKNFVNEIKVLIPLAWPANRQGRLVADNMILGNHSAYSGSLGSSILKFFELSVASTGMNEKLLKRFEFEYQSAIITKGSHAGYYPESKEIVMKILFGNDGKIYGAQAVGQEGVDKRIDIIATAIKAGMKVQDLQDIEITYAPPYNSAKDLVNIAGYVAENILKGDLNVISYDQLKPFMQKKDVVLLDVRTPEEFSKGSIDGAVNINVDELRAHIKDLDKSKMYVIYCQVGLRGYLANRILRNHGYKAMNLNGGYNLWKTVFPGKEMLQN